MRILIMLLKLSVPQCKRNHTGEPKFTTFKICKSLDMRTSIIFRKFTSSGRSSIKEFSDESSCDKWESSNIPSDRNDHSYLCIQKNEIEPMIFKKLDEQVIKIDKSVSANEKAPVQIPSAFKENIIPQSSVVPNICEQSTPLPVKKKRGRKPGKRNSQPAKHSFDKKHRIYFSPTLKNPAKYPDLLHFKDDDDQIYLRNTSRDVMLSSTQSFQETPEFLELKEMYLRLCNQRRMKSLYETFLVT